MKRLEIVGVVAIAVVASVFGIYFAGSLRVAPRQTVVGMPPPDFAPELLVVQSASGSLLRGWAVAGKGGGGVVVLAHGIRSNRLSLLDRARMLSDAGYSVVLFDFQGHGESTGEHITFGYLEALDLEAVVAYTQSRFPEERIGIVGTSLGGAALLLSRMPNYIDAIVLEAVYPTIVDAAKNRLEISFGKLGRVLSPLLIAQLEARLGISAED